MRTPRGTHLSGEAPAVHEGLCLHVKGWAAGETHLHGGEEPLHGGDEAAQGAGGHLQVQLGDVDVRGVALDHVPPQILRLRHLSNRATAALTTIA